VVRPDGSIISTRASKCLTPASTERGAALQIQDCGTRSDQVWRVPDQHGRTGEVISPLNKCVDVFNNDVPLGKLGVWDCNGSTAQTWTDVGDGSLGVGGRCLDVNQAGTAAGSSVILSNCHQGTNQRWISRADGTVVNPVSGRCLTGASATNGAVFTIQDCTGAPLQQWRMSPQRQYNGPLVGIGGKCADIKGENPANSTVWLWSCFGPPGETWQAPKDNSLHSMGACLDIGSLANGTAVGVATCHGGNSQQWTTRPDATLVNVESSRCLDVQNGATADGTKMQIWDCVGTPQQRWAIPVRAS
jgi:hypothetical protein